MSDNQYKQKFRDEDFIRVLSPDEPRSAGYISRLVGCHRTTAIPYLRRLATAGSINAVKIDGGESTLYTKK